MHAPNPIYRWITAPFIRLLLPFVVGILLHWYVQLPIVPVIAALVISIIGNGLFHWVKISKRFKGRWLQGLFLNIILLCFGIVITWQKDDRLVDNWYGHIYKTGDRIIAKIDEPPVEKAKSYKANVTTQYIIRNDSTFRCTGKLLLYFSKDSISSQLQYGAQVIFAQALQPIKNSGNPGAFDYQRYAGFQQIFHNAFLKNDNWVFTGVREANFFRRFIFTARESVLTILKKYVNDDKDALGIAEALLIGYTNDLDKDLVQAYSNTGVVHIIAISGMHLGLLYVLLVLLFSKIPVIKKSKLLQVVFILSSLWLFSLMTGAAAAVVRAAVMFTFISIGANISRKSSIYNSLCASAFVMLCYNPYYLWDVGFQLSYLAVVGIIVFQKAVYNWFYVKNKWLDQIWKLAAISLAAQVLTAPICLYYFHQFPNLFLITNIIAVPLSGIILYAEIALMPLAFMPFIGSWTGKLVTFLVILMNRCVLWINQLPFATWDNIPATAGSTLFLYAFVIGLAGWLLNQQKLYFRLLLIGCFGWSGLFFVAHWQLTHQHKLIVYNVPKHTAIDLISQSKYKTIGDSMVLQAGVLQNFHLKPGRIGMQLQKSASSMINIDTMASKPLFFCFGKKTVLVINQSWVFQPLAQPIKIDYIIITGNPKLSIAQLSATFTAGYHVFDASNSLWKIANWQQECSALHLRSHSVPDAGAFIADVDE